jgi:hypothetical protein
MRHGESYGRPWYNHTPVVYSVPRRARPVPVRQGLMMRFQAPHGPDVCAI